MREAGRQTLFELKTDASQPITYERLRKAVLRFRDAMEESRDIAWEEAQKAMKKKLPDKDPSAVTLGRKGGLARMAGLTPRQRAELGRRGAEKRWGKK